MPYRGAEPKPAQARRLPSAPTLSVVVPHFNQPQQLRRGLEALCNQDVGAPTCEIIVVDNGSSVMPTAICDDFNGVTLLCEPERGPGPARNTGASRASGDILGFIDADCVAHPRWLSEIARIFSEHPDKQILGGDVRILKMGDSRKQVEAYESIFAYRMDKYISKKGFTGTGNLAVRRETFEFVGPFSGLDKAEDRDWGRRAVAAGLKIYFEPTMMVHHPPRTDFAELTRKWDRHIAHDYNDMKSKPSGRWRWRMRACAVALSPAIASFEIAASDRLTSLGERVRAFICLVRIRLYRARLMLRLLRRDTADELSGKWG